MSTEIYQLDDEGIDSQKSFIWLGFRAFIWTVIAGIVGGIIYVFGTVFVLLVLGGGLFNSFFSVFTHGVIYLSHGMLISATIASFRFLWTHNFRTPLIIGLYTFLTVSYLVINSITWYQNYQNKINIDNRYIQFRQALHEQRYEVAFAYMSPEYRQNHTPDDVRYDIVSLGDETKALHPQRAIDILGNKATLLPEQYKFWYVGPVLELEKVNGVWYFTENNFFSYD